MSFFCLQAILSRDLWIANVLCIQDIQCYNFDPDACYPAHGVQCDYSQPLHVHAFIIPLK
jgi:fructosamine-3-kinase